MALAREAQAERAALIRYLRAQRIKDPASPAEEYFNYRLNKAVTDIVAGKHVKAVRRG